MEVVFIWIILSGIVGAIGNSRTIGFWSAFLLSLILSPLVGFVIVLFYPSKESQQRSFEQQQMQTQILQSMAASQSSSIAAKQILVADEILKLKSLRDTGAITDEEFQLQKQKLLDNKV